MARSNSTSVWMIGTALSDMVVKNLQKSAFRASQRTMTTSSLQVCCREPNRIPCALDRRALGLAVPQLLGFRLPRAARAVLPRLVVPDGFSRRWVLQEFAHHQ